MSIRTIDDLSDKLARELIWRKKELSDLISMHYEHTGSKVAEKILTNMDAYMDRFIKVISYEYKKVLIEMALEETRKKLASVEKDVEMMSD